MGSSASVTTLTPTCWAGCATRCSTAGPMRQGCGLRTTARLASVIAALASLISSRTSADVVARWRCRDRLQRRGLQPRGAPAGSSNAAVTGSSPGATPRSFWPPTLSTGTIASIASTACLPFSSTTSGHEGCFSRATALERSRSTTPEPRAGWLFASEIKALLVHPQVVPDVNRHALGHYLSFLTTPAPETLFAGIAKVPAAHCGSWSPDHGLETRRWWQLPTDKTAVSFSDAAADVRDLFTAAVRKRMMSDVPFGVYLSGGIDSTSNVAAMSQMMPQPVNTFSIAFAGEPSLNELPRPAAPLVTSGRTLLARDHRRGCAPVVTGDHPSPG